MNHITDKCTHSGRKLSNSDKKKDDEAFEVLGRIFTTSHIDNTKPPAALVHYNNGQPTLFDCYSKKVFFFFEISCYFNF